MCRTAEVRVCSTTAIFIQKEEALWYLCSLTQLW